MRERIATERRRGPERRSAACRHCGAPVPPGVPHAGFCCPGCAAVHRLLRELQLEGFYDLGGGRGRPVGAIPRPGSRDWLPPLVAGGALGGGRVRLEIDVQGIHCAACVWVLRETWRRLDGALTIDLNPARGRAVLVYDAERLDPERWFATVEALGYRVGPPLRRHGRADRGLLVRTGICVALALNAMTFAAADYFGLETAGGPLKLFFARLSWVLATLAVVVGGPVFLKPALAGLKRRVLHLDLPIALGILLAYGGSAVSFLRSGGHAYFDTVTIFVALMLVGRFVQERALARNRALLLADPGLEDLKLRRIEGGIPKLVRAAELVPGDEVLLAPRDLVPLRLELAEGPAAFSFDWIDGEPAPRMLAAGDVVPAGAFLADTRPRRAVVRADLASSGLADLLRPRADGEVGARFWSLLGRGYVLFVLLAAGGAAFLWRGAGLERAVEVAVSVLVATCPCALGLATPLAFEMALARLRRTGVFVRRRDALERARRVSVVAFDKTGTLTWGGLRARLLDALPVEQAALCRALAAASNHPAARAAEEALAALAVRGPRAEFSEIREIPGRGLSGRLAGLEYRLGRPDFVLGRPACARDGADLAFGARGRISARFALEEDLRPGFAEAFQRLRARGLDLWILSGDRPERTARAARRLGLPEERAVGGLGPEDKAAWIERLGPERTLFVGDGGNDAPAFRTALCAATPALDRPVLPARADWFYLGAGASAVEAVLDTAARLQAVIRRNLGFAAVYNAGILWFCLRGAMTPLLVALVMPLASLALLFQVGLSLRPGRARPERNRPWTSSPSSSS